MAHKQENDIYDKQLIEDVEKKLKYYQNFPIKGVNFVDVFSVMDDAELFDKIIEYMARPWIDETLFTQAGGNRFSAVTKVVGIESRGFIFGSRIASELGVPFVPARKPGKLPGILVSNSYTLEYGNNKLEIQKNSINDKDLVLIVDDVLATGGTVQCVAKLVEDLGAKIAGVSLFYIVKEFNSLDKLIKYKIRFLI